MTRRRFLLPLLALSAAWGLSACSGTSTSSSDAGPVDDAATADSSDGDVAADGGTDAPSVFVPTACLNPNAKLSVDVAPIMQQSCSGGDSCHGLSTPAIAYAFLSQPATECADSRLIAAPSDPAHSYVVQKLTNTTLCSGGPMPKRLGGSWQELSQQDVQTIYDWICAGAKND